MQIGLMSCAEHEQVPGGLVVIQGQPDVELSAGRMFSQEHDVVGATHHGKKVACFISSVCCGHCSLSSSDCLVECGYVSFKISFQRLSSHISNVSLQFLTTIQTTTPPWTATWLRMRARSGSSASFPSLLGTGRSRDAASCSPQILGALPCSTKMGCIKKVTGVIVPPGARWTEGEHLLQRKVNLNFRIGFVLG